MPRKDEIVIAPLPELTAPTVESLITNATEPGDQGHVALRGCKVPQVIVGEKPYVLGTDKDLTASGNSWSLTLPEALADGDYTVSAEVSDAAWPQRRVGRTGQAHH